MSDKPRPFQKCGSCRQVWPTWEGFARDPEVRVLGLQAVADNPDINLLVFEHRCGSTISVLSKRLRHLLPDPEPDAPAERLLGTEQCEGRCLRLGDLEQCNAPCSNARDRRLILTVQRMKEEASAGDGFPVK